MLYQKGHDFGMVMFGTTDTHNALADRLGGKEYTNVTTARHISKIDLEFFRDLDTYTAEEEMTKKGDMVDGLIVAIDMLNNFCGTKKYKKRIFLITDGERETKTSKAEVQSLID
jgi:arginine utilization protein RocB